MKKTNGKMTHIGELLGNVLESCSNKSDSEMTRIWDFWDDAVGSTVAENAQPEAFRKNILIVKVSCSAWMHQLHFLKKEIIKKLI